MIYRRRGFTLIEAMSVVAIIGILAALGTYIAFQAQRYARDVKRKNDLYAISQAFEARYLDRTCNNAADVGRYPGLSTAAVGRWVEVRTIATLDDCYVFSQYLPTIPSDPQQPTYSYYFNLSTVEQSNNQSIPALAKHYRLAASLERGFAANSPEQQECVHQSGVWQSSFGAQPYDCKENVIGKTSVDKLVAGIGLVSSALAATGTQQNCQVEPGPSNSCPQTNPNPDVILPPPNGGNTGGGNNSGGNTGGNGSGSSTNQVRDYNYYVGR